ncbi:EpsG family protein [Streptococcus suis]|uniref:EpsG family protein n=1 Tax=Streptococcus suis TaxID=1307 RepID=UPI003466B574
MRLQQLICPTWRTILVTSRPDLIGGVETGYSFLMDLFRSHHFTFLQFRATILIVSYVLIWLDLVKIKANKNLVLPYILFFLIILMLFNFVTFCSRHLATFLYGFTDFMLDNKNGTIEFSITTWISSLFHLISYIYFILLLTHKKITNFKFMRQLFVAIFVSLLLVSILFRSQLLGLFSSIFIGFNREKATYYLNEETRNGFLVFWFFEIVFLYISYLLHNQNKKFTFLSEFDSKVVEKIFWINLILTFLFPISMINFNFSRIFRNILIINYGLGAYVLLMPKIRARQVAALCFCVVYLFQFLYNL